MARLKTVISALACLGLAGSVRAADDIQFNRDIRPILSEYCFACHGPDVSSRKADLRLDVLEGATAEGAIVPGDAKKSEAVVRIFHDDPDEIMPPPDSHKVMSREHRELLARWIDAGAPWQEHWAFIRPVRPVPPSPDGIASWAKTPVDHFILETLQNQKLKPNPEAGRATLARRAALDLTGLPPDPKQLRTFLEDGKEDAYGRFVGVLLASEAAAEHRSRFWLDAARYGDTHGMHLDNYREIWPYRDWVIEAFRNNLPFDQFTVQQIAGDLLPKATQDQRIATGFGRCNVTTAEGGSIPEELKVRYMVDRVETTGTVFLGLTAGCSVCHDHKYDPLTMRDFYSMGAFFNHTTQPAMDGNQKDSPPVVVLPNEANAAEWKSLQAQRAELNRKLRDWSGDAAESWNSRQPLGAHPVGTDKLALWLPLSKSAEPEAPLPAKARWAEDHPVAGRGIRFDDRVDLPGRLTPLHTDKPFSVSFWVRTPEKVISTVFLEQMITTGEDKAKKTTGWKITSSVQGAVTFEIQDGTGKRISGLLPGDEALSPRSWQHVLARYSGGRSNSSFSILVNGKERVMRNASQSYIDSAPLAEVPLKIAPNLPTGGMSDLRVFNRWLSDEEAELLAGEFRLRNAIDSKASWKELAETDRELFTSFQRQAGDSAYQKTARQLAATRKRHDFIYSRSDTTLVMQELRRGKPRAWILERGEYDKRRDEVGPEVPAFLPPLAKDAPRNRLGLAQWLVDPENPLTARVTVNRLWQSLFGIGLVKTTEDFGVMGTPPSHPELLDWLAVEFVESGWDVRHLIELMATSAAYRQSATLTPEKLAADPENRFLSRGPRYRLDAEVLRDQALAVSGLLNPAVGGPSVKPYQPAGIWKVVAFAGSNTRQFKQDTGDALYRRSLYTFWKRTSPPPTMEAFNAPTRESCTVRRERTNTPLQALVLMNDPQYVEAARHLAEVTLKTEGDDAQKAEWMLQRLFSRPARKVDLDESLATLADFRGVFAPDPAAAKLLIETGDSTPDAAMDPSELAAWTMVANTLMNRDDFVNKN